MNDQFKPFRIFPAGTKVYKPSGKPFKSGEKINTIKSLTEHNVLPRPAYTFEEDDSIVECFRCIPVTDGV